MHLKHRKFPLIKMIKLQFTMRNYSGICNDLPFEYQVFTGLIFQDNLRKLSTVRDNIEIWVIYPQ